MKDESLFDQPRDGSTFDPDRDYARLNAQHKRVYDVMRGGGWFTLYEVAEQTGDPEASVSARLRDFRKGRFGKHAVERQYLGVGLWEYRLVWNDSITRPEDYK